MTKPLDHLSDAELLRRMLAGEGGAFAALYQRWQASVYRFSLRLSGSEALAEDITQDVFLTLMRDGAQYHGRGTFAAYLFTITRHSTLRRLQRERRFVGFETDAFESDEAAVDVPLLAETDPLAKLTRNETAEAVRQAVQGLPLHYREVVLLCHLRRRFVRQAPHFRSVPALVLAQMISIEQVKRQRAACSSSSSRRYSASRSIKSSNVGSSFNRPKPFHTD